MNATPTTRYHPHPTAATAGVLLGLIAALTLTLWATTARSQNTGPPQDIVLMLDNSGSMRKNDPEFLTRLAVTTFIERLRGDIQVAIIMFDQNVRELMPLTQLNDATRQDFLNSLAALNYHGQLTNSPAALEKSTYVLRTKGRPGSQKSIIFMTDGIVDVGKDGFDEGDVEKARWMKTTLVEEAAKYQIRIYGIAYTDNADFELIQTLSSKTGGEYYRAANADEIESVFDKIRGALANQGPASPTTPATTAAESPTPPADESQAAPESAEESTTASPALPEASLPTTTEPEATLPEAPLPESTLPEATLPDSSLPEASLPEATLPETSLPDTTQPEETSLPEAGASAAAGTAADSAGATSTTAETQNPPQASAAEQEQPAQPPATTPQPAAATLPTAPPAQKLPVALLAGASALLLALIAIVLFLIKRKPSAASTTDPLMPKAFLNDIGNATGQNSYELGGKPTIIGRLQGSDPQAANYIVIDEPTIGRRHSLIEYKEHSFWVADQNSLNGTYVNNKRIEASTRLKHGDRLRFHKHEFEFLVLDMFETDRTMMSQTVFAERTGDLDEEDDDATEIREPSGEDETIRRPDS